MCDTSDNVVRQFEELEALKSIYGEEWREDGLSGSYSIALCEGPLRLELFITLPEEYPGQSPALFQILAPSLSRTDMQEVTNLLQDEYLENIGETVIFQWIEKAREWLQDKAAAMADDGTGENATAADHKYNDNEEEEEAEEEEMWAPKQKDDGEELAVASYECPRITHGDPISFKKSTFQGHVAAVVSTDQIKQVIAKLKENKKVANATHNMYAYRIYREDVNSYSQDCDDDGESQAGGRLLHLLQIMDVRNLLVVVTRWYGGVHLGPDRFRLINNAARQVIEKAGLIPSSEPKRKK